MSHKDNLRVVEHFGKHYVWTQEPGQPLTLTSVDRINEAVREVLVILKRLPEHYSLLTSAAVSRQAADAGDDLVGKRAVT